MCVFIYIYIYIYIYVYTQIYMAMVKLKEYNCKHSQNKQLSWTLKKLLVYVETQEQFFLQNTDGCEIIAIPCLLYTYFLTQMKYNLEMQRCIFS